MTTAGAAAAVRERTLLEPSKLGTREYWETAYARELRNNTESGLDEGIVWFEESNAEMTVLKLLSSYRARSRLDPAQSRFLDLGTGNGHMLFELREDEDDDDGTRWTGQLVGVDYSPKSVELARQLDAQRTEALEEAEGYATVQFEQWDILTEDAEQWLGDGFDAVLDKGTFDAISLMPHSGSGAHPCDTYRDRVTSLIRPGKFLFITSCNWTKSELIDWLAPKNGELSLFDEANYKTYTFGGHTGQTVVTLVFRRAAQS